MIFKHYALKFASSFISWTSTLTIKDNGSCSRVVSKASQPGKNRQNSQSYAGGFDYGSC